MNLPLFGKVSLVTGASRGIGAATARKLALLGSDIVINYRSKAARAEEISRSLTDLGRRALTVQADLTVDSETEAMITAIEQTFGQLDLLILNASGGLEKGKPEDYAMALNHTAQIQTARLATRLMANGGRIVFVTSHSAHFYGQKRMIPGYEVVAKSKYAGEQALRQYAKSLTASDISLVVVSGDAIEGTITPRLLERMNPGMFDRNESESRKLPTVDEFAEAIAMAAMDRSLISGQTIFIGSID